MQELSEESISKVSRAEEIIQSNGMFLEYLDTERYESVLVSRHDDQGHLTNEAHVVFLCRRNRNPNLSLPPTNLEVPARIVWF